MGYSTDFYGSVGFNKPITEELYDYIKLFNEVRHMKRDVEKIKKIYPNWQKFCFNGELGSDGEYFIGEKPFNEADNSIVDYNCPPNSQPGLWCQWIINRDGELEWDGGEKFYEYEEWLRYLINHFFAPSGYILNGEIEFQGEDRDDFGIIIVKDNVVTVEYGERIMGLKDIKTEDLITEIKNRGYKVIS